MALLYLQDLDDTTGPLLLAPRRVGEPTGPPQDPALYRWEGAVELRPPAGSVVAIEQCTWHAVRPVTADSPPIFVGTTFATRTTSPGAWVDPRLASRFR